MQPIYFRQLEVPGLAIFSYLVGDPASKECIALDPTRNIAPIIEALQKEGLHLKAILETHVHADFITGAKELKEYYQGKPMIYCSSLGGQAWFPTYADVPVIEGTEVAVGPYRFKARHTPGHTPEHVIWMAYDDARSKEVPWSIFTGDLLFVGGVGRPDLLGEEQAKVLSKELYKSLFTRISDLPDFVEIYPTHGSGSLCGKISGGRSSSTLGYERRFNKELQPISEEQWIARLTKEMPTAPHGFATIKKQNAEGSKMLPEIASELREISYNQLKELTENSWMIDLRDAEAYAAGHLKGAVNMMPGLSFCSWAQMVIPTDAPVILIAPEAALAAKAAQDLRLVGIDQILGYFLMQAFQGELVQLKMISPEELHGTQSYTIVDVRTPAEWSSGHIPGACHLELAKAAQSLAEIPRGDPIVVVCARGNRASVIASLLQKEGEISVANMRGGMNAWQKAGLPLIVEKSSV